MLFDICAESLNRYNRVNAFQFHSHTHSIVHNSCTWNHDGTDIPMYSHGHGMSNNIIVVSAGFISIFISRENLREKKMMENGKSV